MLADSFVERGLLWPYHSPCKHTKEGLLPGPHLHALVPVIEGS
jgi:hypothetical protein